MATIQTIRSMVIRTEKLLSELTTEYDKCQQKKFVSDDACNITHEILEKCSNALDQLMYAAWSARIAPQLTELPKRGGYFPIARDEKSYKSMLRQWKAESIESMDAEFSRILRECQPMTNPQNEWMAKLRELANKKHSGLLPQTKIENKITTVERGDGAISWDAGQVRFSPGVVILGAPIDARTQLPKPMPGMHTKSEIWVTFILEGTNLNALGFCQSAVAGTKRLIEIFASTLSLP